MIVVLIAALYAHTQSMPPLVVVESSSMVHDSEGEVGSIDAGDLILVHKSSFENIVTFAEATDPSNPYFGHESHGMEGDVVIYKKNGESSSTPIIHRAILRVVPNEAYSASSSNTCPNGGVFDSEWSINGTRGACILTWDVPEPMLSIKAPSPSRLMASMQLTTIASVLHMQELKHIWSFTNGRLSMLDC